MMLGEYSRSLVPSPTSGSLPARQAHQVERQLLEIGLPIECLPGQPSSICGGAEHATRAAGPKGPGGEAILSSVAHQTESLVMLAASATKLSDCPRM